MKIRPLFFTACAALAFGSLSTTVSAAEAEVGKPAPAFSLPGADGKTHSLEELKGKVVVLEWTNPECPFVKKFYNPGKMQELQKELTGKGVVWYRINSNAPGEQGSQTPEQLAAYDKSQNVAATGSLSDLDSKVATAYGAKTTPHIYLINAEGVLVYNGAIDSKSTPRSEDIDSAENYLKAAVEETLAGKPVSKPTTKPYGCGVKYAK